MQSRPLLHSERLFPNAAAIGTRLLRRIRNRVAIRSRTARYAFRLQNFLYRRSLKPLSRREGDRLVEERIRICRLPLSISRWQRDKFRIALLVDEFFGGFDTAIGGYGALARNYICKYIPSDLIDIDVILDDYGDKLTQHAVIDRTNVYRLSSDPIRRQLWFDTQAYDLLLSIEMTEPSFRILSKLDSTTPLLYWVQDPRDPKLYQPRLQTVNLIRDFDWSYVNDVEIWMREAMSSKRVTFISQGNSLSHIARKLYHVPDTLPIKDLPNPVELDLSYKLNEPPKENKIIFLGRLEAQKRVWIFCEIAKRMPQHQFYVLGATGKNRNEAANAKTLEPYRNPDGSSKIPNLHFTGHVEGLTKHHHIKTAKLLLNTSIWEGIPVSWLESLSYGTLIVSAFDRDDIVSRFGSFVGEVMGDGTAPDQLEPFITAITHWMTHNELRNALARLAIDFVRARHSIPAFVENMRAQILGAIP